MLRYTYIACLVFLKTQQLQVGQGLVIIEASRSHSVGDTTLDRASLDEGSVRRRNLYLTTHNIHNRQTSTLSAEFEPAIPKAERLQTHALGRTATGMFVYNVEIYNIVPVI